MKKDKKRLKKQLVSGGIYIALAAAVVTVTLNGVNNIIDSSTEIKIPEVDYTVPELVLELPRIESDTFIFGEKSEKDKPIYEALPNESQINVSDYESGVDSLIEGEVLLTPLKEEKETDGNKSSNPEVDSKDGSASIEESGEVNVSGEPSGIEYPTEPDIQSYGIYAKPADGYIDREFSLDELIYSPTMGDYRTHNGIDITGDIGSPVRSIGEGVVVDVYFDDFYGHTVAINHGDGIVAYYMNLSESVPQEIVKNARVTTGQIIGGIGDSAALESADISHLHLSFMKNGKYIDPGEFLRA